MTRAPGVRWSAWAAVAVLLVLARAVTPAPSRARAGDRAEDGWRPARLTPWLGPLAGLASDLSWIRYQRALRAGSTAEALVHADRALALAPASTDGWTLLASHLAFFRASPERELDLERRRRWLAAGLETARRGALWAAEPGELHALRGLVLLSKAELDPALHPEGAEGLRRDARAALREAAAAGHAPARALLATLEAP